MPESAHSTLPIVRGFPLGPFETNCYVVRAPGDPACWIIDAGFQPDALIDHVRSEDLAPERIILTHAHVDHMAGLEEIRRAFPGVPTSIHEAEREWLTNPVLNLSAGWGEMITARPPEDLLSGGEELELAGTRWSVLFTPGHSPGGITLYNDASLQALVGDTLFAGSIGRHDFPTSSFDDLQRSIREYLYSLPDDTTVFPGHGPETTIGREAQTNPFVRRT